MTGADVLGTGLEPRSHETRGARRLLSRDGAAVTVLQFIHWRIVPGLVTLLLISVVVFFSTHGLGIDPARRALGREATATQVTQYRHAHGLDKPVYSQFGVWLWDFTRGDWGMSEVGNQPVTEVVIPRIKYTAILAITSIIVGLPLSIVYGTFLARPGPRPRELGLSILTVALAAIPIFVVGMLLMYLFSIKLGWTPVDSSGLAFGTAGQKVAAFVLPTLTLAISLLPHVSRITQVSVRETMSAPYARAAVLRGLSRRTIMYRHLMPNAAGPIINVVALELIWLVGGVIVVENVFGFPGLGNLLVQSIAQGNIAVLQAVAVLTGALFICIGLAADALARVFNPRLRSG